MLYKKYLMLMIMIAVVVGLSSCSNDDDNGLDPIDDDGEVIPVEERYAFNLADQPLTGTLVVVEDLKMMKNGWIVVTRDNGNNFPDFSAIISIPSYVEAGNHDEFSIHLKDDIDLHQGERLWVNLHNDNGDEAFSYDPNNRMDLPLGWWDLYRGFIPISHSFTVELPDNTGS